ncbi:MAG: L-ribulose-5-phosphate 3-epimerase [Anaerolineaceae bacterium]
MNEHPNNLIGIYEKGLPYSATWVERLLMAKAIGFDYVELSIDEDETRIRRLDWSAAQKHDLLAISQDINIPFLSMSLSAHRKFPLGSTDPQKRRKAKDMFSKAIDLACDLNIRILQIMGYWVFYEPIQPESRDLFLDGLHWGIEKAASQGVMLGIENVEGREHISSISQAMGYVQAINSPWFQLYSDFANLYALCYNVPQELRKGKGHFIAIHVKDAKPNQVRRIPFGEGCVNFLESFNTMAELDFHGPFLIEMWNDDAPESEQIIKTAFQKTCSFLEKSKYAFQ